MEEYTATTLERARHVLKKFPLSDGAKMAIGKDLEYGYTWAALPENKRALVATMPPIKPGVFTVFTTEGHTLNLTGNALTQMITNARTRHRNTKARIRAYRTRENNPTRFAGRKGVDYTASAEREQRDYEAGIRNTFRIAGWGDVEFTALDDSDNGVDRTRGEVAETPEHPAPVANGEQTDTGTAIRDTRPGTAKIVTRRQSAAYGRGPQIQPQQKTVVWVADGRDGDRRKRIVVRAGATDLTGEL
jgi:hypothetical protein